MRRVWIGVLLLALAAGSAVADGPETGLVSGVITDASGSPLPGVAITISGDRGQKAAVTEADGSYRFALLVPGSYVVKAELEGMGTADETVQVTAGQRSEVNLTLKAGTAETITVTDEAPMVDKFNVSAGSTMQSEIGVEVTGENRTFYGVVNFMPGVTNEDENTDLSSTRPNINGATWADSTVYIDGVDTTFSRYGGTRVFLPSSATTEVSLESGGLGADYGRTVGSATNVIVKSGTNNWHGDFVYSHTEEEWNSEYKSQPAIAERESNPQPPDFLKRTDEELDDNDSQYETSFGGPIKRDKAWFFVSVNEQNTNATGKTINGDFVDESGNVKSRIAKINFQPSTKHSLSVSWIDTPVLRNFVLEPVFDRYTVTPHDISGELYTASYNVSLTSKFFLEAKLADQTSNEDKLLAVGGFDLDEALRIKQQDERFPANPAGGPDWPGNVFRPYLDDDGWHNGWLLDNGFGTNKFPRTQVNLAATQFAGANHELKYGFDGQEVKWESDVQRLNLYSGQGNNLFDAQSVTGYINPLLPLATARATANNTSCNFLPGQIGSCILQDYFHPILQNDFGNGDTKSTNMGLYLRDRFTVGDHWTFNVGVRGEQQVHENDIGREVMDDTTISPRGSLSYDIKGDGRQLVTLYGGRSYHQLPQEAVNQFLMDQFNGYNGYERRLYCAPALIAASAAVPAIGCQGFQPGYTRSLGFVLPGLQWDLVDRGVWDADIEAYYKDEVILGYEWQFSRNWALKADAIWWEVDNLIGSTTQLAENPANGRLTVFFLTANHDDYPKILNAIREAASPANRASLAQASVLAGYESPFRDYEALQLQVNRRFADNWALYSNVTFSEAGGSSHGDVFNNTNDSYGENLEQVLRAADLTSCQNNQANRTVPVNCAEKIGQFLGQPLSTINREGKANFDRPVIFKATGWKAFNITQKQSFTLGGHVTWQSGANWERTESLGGVNPTGEPTEIAVTVPLEPEGSRHIDPHYWVNLSGAYGFPMWKELTGEFRLEVQNVTNEQDQIGVTGRGEARALRRVFQRPQRFRALFGVRF
jgi:hypothetical protein